MFLFLAFAHSHYLFLEKTTLTACSDKHDKNTKQHIFSKTGWKVLICGLIHKNVQTPANTHRTRQLVHTVAHTGWPAARGSFCLSNQSPILLHLTVTVSRPSRCLYDQCSVKWGKMTVQQSYCYLSATHLHSACSKQVTLSCMYNTQYTRFTHCCVNALTLILHANCTKSYFALT